jgi:hypothetical protein
MKYEIHVGVIQIVISEASRGFDQDKTKRHSTKVTGSEDEWEAGKL